MGRRTLRHAALFFVCLGAMFALGACAGTQEQTAQTQVQKARQLCLDLGYKAGTTEFARCAQSEYDRMASAAPAPTSTASNAPASTAPAQPQSDDWFERWVHKPPVCDQRACSAW